MTIDDHYNLQRVTLSDIYEHLPTLKKYTEECESVVELGVRYIVSTWAFLAGHPRTMLSVDIEHPSAFGADIMEVYDLADGAGITYNFIQKSSLNIDLPEHDFLFIDTLHTYNQLSAELDLHHSKAKKYIAMHDTNLDGDPDNMRGAISDFLNRTPEWEVAEQFDNNNGLTILKRK